MTVNLSCNINALQVLSVILGDVYKSDIATDQISKLVKSICYDLADKFDKKYKTQRKKVTLFDADKLHKVTLKYHEGWALEKIIAYSIIINNNDILQRAILSKLHLQIQPQI